MTYFAAPGSLDQGLACAQTWLVLQVASVVVGLYPSVVVGLCSSAVVGLCTWALLQASEAAGPCASGLSRWSKSGSLNHPVPCQIHH